MPTFAILNKENVVTNRVISDNVEFVKITLGNDVILVEETNDTGYACIGEKYLDSGVFQTPQPFASWTWSNTLIQWEPPIECPTDGKPYFWNEEMGDWEEAQPKPEV